ncbi:hypothetical protein J4H86_13530 [Spiractinospora alimapuensis]|uniref:hypothetical protein n=1 Tax=Spiractinospora alimapuensis TaxID=2820884 RepID=UPI001F3F6354|nr:hypothetical protein [Spiractinospora alimapuensis]QVQ49999.1 hypothetical protein J4H86_13530 [Spiractinospora alimapuensis]
METNQPTPADVPPERYAEIDRLEPLVGRWSIETVLPEGQEPSGQEPAAWTTFEWLSGRFFLVQRWAVDLPEAPDGIAVIGIEPTSIGGPFTGPLFTQRYFDSRGVHRVYAMTLDDGLWRLWRDSPGFAQRFRGEFSADGDSIEGAWDKSADGVTWQRDLTLRYRRVG